jgi:hypothetical protein
MFWTLGFILVVLAIGNNFRVRANAETSLRTWAKGQRYEVISLEVTQHAHRSRYSRTPGEAQVVLRRQDLDLDIPGRLSWDGGLLEISGIEFFPFRSISNAERRAHGSDVHLDEERLATLYIEDDGEAQVLNEVNRRLDSITSQPNWMEPYDLDGSGHVDEEEWSILRGNIMEEVRGELGDPGVRSVMTPAQGVDAVHKLPAPVAQEDGEEDVLW